MRCTDNACVRAFCPTAASHCHRMQGTGRRRDERDRRTPGLRAYRNVRCTRGRRNGGFGTIRDILRSVARPTHAANRADVRMRASASRAPTLAANRTGASGATNTSREQSRRFRDEAGRPFRRKEKRLPHSSPRQAHVHRGQCPANLRPGYGKITFGRGGNIRMIHRPLWLSFT
jgi:hypothetical protein